MEELENTNPIMDNPGENPLNSNDLQPTNPTTEPQQSPDFSQLFSENITENNEIQNEPISFSDTPDLQNNQQETINSPELTEQQPENQASQPIFEDMVEHTVLDNPQNLQPTQQTIEEKPHPEQQKKSENSGFTKGILSGVLLTLLVFIACSLFAKNQLISTINYLDSLVHTNNVNYTNDNPTTENNQKSEENQGEEETEMLEENSGEISGIQQYYDRIDEILSSENDQETKVVLLKNMLTEVMQKNEEINQLTQYISQNIMDLTINSEDPQNEENIENQESDEEEINNSESINETENENNEPNNNIEEDSEEPEEIINESVDNSELNEDLNETTVEQNSEKYTITHVNSEEEANWVLPAQCSDLTCYDENEEFVPCTKFREDANLEPDSQRIRSSGACKYKDSSELVFVEFNN